MKRTFILLISAVVMLSACGQDSDHKKEEGNKEEQSSKKDSSSVKQKATDKDVQGNDYRTILPLKKVKHVAYCKITWQIAITVKTLKVAYWI